MAEPQHTIGYNLEGAGRRLPRSRYESLIADGTGVTGRVIADAAHVARSEFAVSGSPGAGLEIEGTQFIGLSIAAFLQWVRASTIKHRNGSVYFLARDGELPYRMALAMHSSHWRHTTLDYLHCNRKAWSVPAAGALGVEQWVDMGVADHHAFLRHSATDISVGALVRRIGMRPDEITNVPALRGLDPNQSLPDGSEERWLEALRSTVVHEIVEQRSSEQRSLVTRWLQANIGSELQSSRPALVDVGWRGQQSRMISAIFREALDVDPLHLHFGGLATRPEIDCDIDIERFAFDDIATPCPIEGVVACFEMFLDAGSERLTGYREAGGAALQVFEPASRSLADSTLRRIWRGAEAVAAGLGTVGSTSSAGEESPATERLAQQVRLVLHAFWDSPDASEVRALSDLTLEVDESGDIRSPVVVPYTFRELLSRHRLPRQWPQGSLALSSTPMQSAIRLARLVRR